MEQCLCNNDDQIRCILIEVSLAQRWAPKSENLSRDVCVISEVRRKIIRGCVDRTGHPLPARFSMLERARWYVERVGLAPVKINWYVSRRTESFLENAPDALRGFSGATTPRHCLHYGFFFFYPTDMSNAGCITIYCPISEFTVRVYGPSFSFPLASLFLRLAASPRRPSTRRRVFPTACRDTTRIALLSVNSYIIAIAR